MAENRTTPPWYPGPEALEADPWADYAAWEQWITKQEEGLYSDILGLLDGMSKNALYLIMTQLWVDK